MTDIHVQKESNRGMKEKCDEEAVIESCHLINCRHYEGQNIYIKEGEKRANESGWFFSLSELKMLKLPEMQTGTMRIRSRVADKDEERLKVTGLPNTGTIA